MKKARLTKIDNGAPRWLSCTWRREPCGKRSCPVCGVLSRECRVLRAGGASDDEVLSAIDDLRYDIADAFLKIVHIPSVSRVRTPRRVSLYGSLRYKSLYRALDSWHEELHEIYDEAFDINAFWRESVDAADLDWYAHILLDYFERLREYQTVQSVARRYAVSVAHEAAQMMVKCLHSIALCDSAQKGALILLSHRFTPLYKELMQL